jgi:hypothetical protein
VTTTIRSYNAFVDRWELLGMDRGNGLQDMGTGGRDGGEIRIEQRFGVAAGGTPNILRIRYHDIGRIVSPGRPIDPLTAARPGCAPFRRSRLDASGPPVRWAHWHRRENEDIIRELRALIG